MNKQEFLDKLKAALHGLPQEDREERLSFYAEMIEALMEEGFSEEDAVSQVGAIDAIATQSLVDTDAGRKRAKLKPWEIVLMVLGFPVWGSLLIATIVVVLSLYVSLWAIIISLWAVQASFSISSVGGIVMSLIYLVQGHGASAAMMLSCSLVVAGLAIFFFFGCKAATKCILLLTKNVVFGMRKEKEHE